MKTRNFFLLLFLASLWGPSFLFIKVAVAEIPPITLVLARVGIAAVLLYLVLRLQGHNLPGPSRIWGHIAIVALFHNSLPFVLLSWGEQHIDSAIASIVNGTTPIFTILLAHMLTTDDRLTSTKVVGVTLGMLGMVLLVAPSLVGGVEATTLGLLAVIAVSASYGLAMVYSRKHLRGMEPLVAPTGQFLLATLYLLPLVLLIDRPLTLSAPSTQAIASLLALAVFGTALAFIVYYRLIESADASYVSMVTYLVPVFGVILGVLILGERLSWNAYVAFAMILIGVMIVNGLFQGWTKRIRAQTRSLIDRRNKRVGDSALPG